MVVKINSFDFFGRGVTRVENKVCFVKGAQEGETVEIEIIEDHSSYLIARVTKYLETSPNRILPICPYYEKCGGCHLAEMTYGATLRMKEKNVLEQLKRNGFSSFSYFGIVDGTPYHYRNKLTLHSDGKRLGLYQEGTHQVVSIDRCLLVDDRINRIIPTLPREKEVMIRVSNENDDMLIGKSKDTIISSIGSYQYRISSSSFFQVNHEMCEKLYDYIYDTVKEIGVKKPLDLYCGVGTIGIYIHDLVTEVLGIEVLKEAVIDAKFNQELNQASNVSFLCGDVSSYISKLEQQYDFVIVDPPRGGLSKKVILELFRISPTTILYVSCNPATLIRDLKRLEVEYSLSSIKLFDMFPNTYHVECVCVLNRR